MVPPLRTRPVESILVQPHEDIHLCCSELGAYIRQDMVVNQQD